MGRKTGLEAGRAGPRSLHSSRALSPGGHGCRHCESVTAGQAKGGLGSLFSAERAGVVFFCAATPQTDRYTLIDTSINSSYTNVFRDLPHIFLPYTSKEKHTEILNIHKFVHIFAFGRWRR